MCVLEVAETGKFIFGGDKEEGIGRIEWKVGDKQGGGSAPGHNNGQGMRAGLQGSK